MPVSPTTFMHLAGVVEIAVGVIILLGYTRFGGFAAAAWLAAIVVNLLTSGAHLDVAARDAVMVIAAFTLGRLTEVRQTNLSSVRDEGEHGGHAHAHA
jgi:Na+(H+)/acetate symporter ActP